MVGSNDKGKLYPFGIQMFSEIVKGGYVDVDKTDLVWQLQNYAKFIFLSRLRRFGKSLFTTTVHSLLSGQKELFEGLKIMKYEKELTQYPVIHAYLSTANGQTTTDDLWRMLLFLLKPWGEIYGEEGKTSPGMMLTRLIRRAHEQTGKQVVILTDENEETLESLKMKSDEYRVNMVVRMPETVYVFELKLNGSVKEALNQINKKNYAVQYQTDKRKVIKTGMNFSSETKTLTDSIIT